MAFAEDVFYHQIVFNIYWEIIFRKSLEDEEIGIQVNGHWINNIRYADDAVLIDETGEELQRMVNRLHTESESLGLKINKTKAKIMKVSKTLSTIKVKVNDTKL